MWKAGSLVLGLVILGVLAYDVNIHGSFESKLTRPFKIIFLLPCLKDCLMFYLHFRIKNK